MSKGNRRPYLSLSGPKNICPAAKPIMLVVKPNCTAAAEVLKYFVIDGSVGRYMSVMNGPNALSIPSKISRKRLELVLIIYNHYSACKVTSKFCLDIPINRN